jgi:peroxiredoxin
LSDGNAEFTNAAGLAWDLSAVAFGVRSKRFSIVANDGVITAINVEEDSSKCTVSDAATLLAAV